jgi:hypothetical protein
MLAVAAATAAVAKNNNQLKPAVEKVAQRSMQPLPQSF